MKNFVTIEHVEKSFGKVFALRDVSLSLEEKGQYVIRGASGSGKSTLLYLLAGLDRATKGKIEVGGKEISKLSDEELGHYRNHEIGLVFQFHFLLPSMNCLDNVLLPSRIGGVYSVKLKKELKDLADNLGVAHCLNKYPYELSGGEQQRINLIRALALRPKLLLCDEPTGSLDSENSENVVRIISRLAKENGSTLVVVTHDDKVASHFSKEFVIHDGILRAE